jgi:hypothetical protein
MYEYTTNPKYAKNIKTIFKHTLQLINTYNLGIINLYINVKYTNELNNKKPFSTSKISKSIIISIKEPISSSLSAFIKKKNKTPKSGGKSRYILLKL